MSIISQQFLFCDTCDECSTLYGYQPDPNRHRQIMKKKGWHCIKDEDICPKCWKKRKAKKVNSL